MTAPFVSIVVLNYNSLRFLDDCFGSIARLDYPGDRYEVVLVDNASSDGSADLAQSRFPWIRVVRNPRNLGFAGGNNAAMRAAHSDYVVLLNNDTQVDPQWLTKLVEAAEGDPLIGACSSKLLFKHNRARVQLEATPFRPRDYDSSDERELGVQLFEARVTQGEWTRRVEYLDGFHGAEASPNGAFQWSSASSILGLRVLPEGGPAQLRMKVAAPRPTGSGVRMIVRFGDMVLGEWEAGPEPQEVVLVLPPSLVEGATPVIQNAGTLILADGSGRDRGTRVRGTEVFQEDDRGQYDLLEEVFAGCGAALLLRRAMLEDVGLFDEDFFMYYEDMDLCWRARRRGWKVVYAPGAVVRHLHAGSSVEWSPFFVYHVERSRLLMLGKNAPSEMAVREHLRYTAEAALNLGRVTRSLLLRSTDGPAVIGRLRIQLRVLAFLTGQLPRTLGKRRSLAHGDVVPPSKLLSWMVSA